MNQHLEKTIANLRNSAVRCERFERYYAGDHDLSFATDKFRNAFGTLFREFALNLCPAVCDAVRDKLKITGFGIDDAVDEPDVRRAAAEIWARRRMPFRSGEVHKEALKTGDAYVIVWPAGDGSAGIYPQRSSAIAVEYDEEEPGRVLSAAKMWTTAAQRTRLNVFFADRVEKYETGKRNERNPPDAGAFTPFTSEGPSVVENPYGVVPVFHFANNADIGAGGLSELEPAIPIQNAMNKSVLDMLVAMEFSAFRQRWAAGIEIEYDTEGNAVAPFKTGIDHLWISENAEARFGDFAAADLEQFLKVKDSFRADIASTTGTPLYYLLPQLRGFPSGESFRKAETRFIAKVRSRQEAFGNVWADIMQFALRIGGHGRTRLRTIWEHPENRSEREILENILLKRQIGVSAEQALIEAGYGSADGE